MCVCEGGGGRSCTVPVHQEPPSGEWTHLATELTDKSGRVAYRIPPNAAAGFGVFPVKMVVRGRLNIVMN